jgi:hypothetical protein
MRPKLLVLSATIACSLLGVTAVAQTACVPSGRPVDPDYQSDTVAEWPREAQRIKSIEQLVSRQRDRLRLVLDGSKSLELIDCPYGDDGYHYLYERYDQPGRFHVVRKLAPDDLSYALVMMPTGHVFTAYGAPVWTSEKNKFLTIGCSLQPARGTLVIQAPQGDGLATEAEFPLPCDSESCSARWDHASWISVICTPRDAGGKKGSEFVLIRSNNNGPWQKFGR